MITDKQSRQVEATIVDLQCAVDDLRKVKQCSQSTGKELLLAIINQLVDSTKDLREVRKTLTD